MKTSQRGIDLIKSFEGLSLRAVQLKGEQYWTIGYGHYGPDVKAGQVITKAEAEALLRQDLRQFEAWVTRFAPWPLNQNEFDALVSFTYNCGPGSLQSLVKGRTKRQVAEHMMVYTHSGSEAYTQGLINRRTKERALFTTPWEDEEMERWQNLEDVPAGYYRRMAKHFMDSGVLNGEGGKLDLTKDMLRDLILAERMDDVILDAVNELEKQIEQLREQLGQGGG